ncbi:MAG: DsbA family oxidoreductase [Eubacteriaceae bacterium]|jgi:predicted DsbA family dithiol-disulfide isomerase
MITIDFWSDYICPYCYMGITELSNAVTSLGLENRIKVVHRAFQIDPLASKNDTASMIDVFAGKCGISRMNAEIMIQGIIRRADSLGLDFSYRHLKNQNTYDIHRLSKYADERGRGTVFSELVYSAFFEENRMIAHNDVLLGIAEDAGLERSGAEKILLNENLYDQMVRRDIQQARSMQIQGVPCFVIDKRYVINGAQYQKTFEDVLKKAARYDRTRSIAVCAQTSPPVQCRI